MRKSKQANSGMMSDDGKLLIEAKNAVFRLYRYRPRSAKEINDKLTQKGFPKKIIAQAVSYFTEIGYINDQQFAQAWIQSRLNKPYGLSRIRRELKLKGISDEIIALTTEFSVQDYSEKEAVIRLARRRAHDYRTLPYSTAQRRLYHYLLRRGFNLGTISQALKEIGKNENSK